MSLMSEEIPDASAGAETGSPNTGLGFETLKYPLKSGGSWGESAIRTL